MGQPSSLKHPVVVQLGIAFEEPAGLELATAVELALVFGLLLVAKQPHVVELAGLLG